MGRRDVGRGTERGQLHQRDHDALLRRHRAIARPPRSDRATTSKQAHAQHPNIPIYVTEVGWPTAVGQPSTGDSFQWTEAEQAQNITNFIDWAKGTGYIADVTIFNYRDYGTNDWYGIESASGAHKLQLHRTGRVRSRGRPKGTVVNPCASRGREHPRPRRRDASSCGCGRGWANTRGSSGLRSQGAGFATGPGSAGTLAGRSRRSDRCSACSAVRSPSASRATAILLCVSLACDRRPGDARRQGVPVGDRASSRSRRGTRSSPKRPNRRS